jgi:FtsZ-binding cell division protein ZapB
MNNSQLKTSENVKKNRKKNKKKSIKKRRIEIYAPSYDIVKNWKKVAAKNKLSLSKFVIETVEDTINEDKTIIEDKQNTFEELREKNKRLQNENIELQKKVDMLERLTDRYDSQLKNFQNKTFIENGDWHGIRFIQKKVTDLFKKHKSIKEDELIDLLHIQPSDTDTLKAVSKQIDQMLDFGIIEKIRGGWRWVK